MKKLLLLAIVAIFTISFASKVSAQDFVDATASGKILEPIQLTIGNSLEFGTWAKIGAGTVTIDPNSSNNVRSTGDLTQVNSNTAARTAASFTVTGSVGYTYVISVDDQITIDNQDGAGDMTVDLSVKSESNGTDEDTPAAKNGTLNAVAGVGTDVFYIGGTMNVESGDVAGSYTTTFQVTVNYN